MNILIEWIAEEEHWMNNQIEWTFEIRYWIEYWIESFLGPIQRLIESSKSIEHPYTDAILSKMCWRLVLFMTCILCVILWVDLVPDTRVYSNVLNTCSGGTSTKLIWRKNISTDHNLNIYVERALSVLKSERSSVGSPWTEPTQWSSRVRAGPGIFGYGDLDIGVSLLGVGGVLILWIEGKMSEAWISVLTLDAPGCHSGFWHYLQQKWHILVKK